MRNVARLIAVIFLLFALMAFTACGGRKDPLPEQDVAPYLYQDSFDIWPNYAFIGEDASFSFGWKDHNGDMGSPEILVRLVNDQGDAFLVQPKEVEIESDDGEYGYIRFRVSIAEQSQGDYYIVVEDGAGNISNEITRYLYVGEPPYQDEEEE